MGKRLAIGTAVVTGLALAAIGWLFYLGDSAPGRPFPLDLAAVRAEATRLPGAGPRVIEVETVSHDAVPRIAMVAGADWGQVDLVRASYRLIYPDGAVVIDAGESDEHARRFGIDRYDRGARTRVLRALDGARLAIFTHEHGDHLGGALTSPRLARIAPRLLLNQAQLAGTEASSWPSSISRPRPFEFQTIRAVAPGVVLIAAPGHTPGSQLVYVRRSDGREYLFLGDTASMLDNVVTGRQRSRLVTRFMSGDDRPAVAAQLRAIGEIAGRNPELVLVPGHDGATIAELARRGLLRPGFR